MRLATFDGHNDVLSRLLGSPGDPVRRFLQGDGTGHVDMPRAEAGGLAGGCFAVFACDPFRGAPDGFAVDYGEPADAVQARAEALAQVALLLRIERAAAGRLRIARCAADLDGPGVAAVLHLEGAEPIDEGLDALEVLHAAGLRSLGLAWSRPNAFATGVPFGFPGSPDQGDGLTAAGRALVRACGERGILVDLSHLNERGFWDVAGMHAAPLVASHSGAHAVCPSPRNLTDAQLRAIGASGGIAGIPFHVGFLRPDGRDDPDTPLAAIAAHAAHVAEVAGAETVALGSDFDGATMPRELADVAALPAAHAALAAQGFSSAELEGIAHGNWRRVLEATWTA
ncbi:MAG TPA: membrane dipeptidase [Solirubrobacteraceae bacterium]|nr:membrane dipeptidase [Solirubrobacteraceae bacterium]